MSIDKIEKGDLSPEEQLGDVCGLETKLDGARSTEGGQACGADNDQESFQEVKVGKRLATIMVAGKPRSGKSTALNNIFGLNLEAKASAKSVTKVVTVEEVNKSIGNAKGKEKEKVTLRIIDTPGLGDIKIPIGTILDDLQNVLSGEDYTLIYCVSVAINTVLDSNDKIIVQNLHTTLGKEVWNKCVLLLTFSDYARLELDKDKYIEHIKSHAHEFQELLKSIDPDLPNIKTVFECNTKENVDRGETPHEIIAIPVNKKPKKSEKILPGMLKENQLWTDIAFLELMKRTSEENREPFVLIRYADYVWDGANYGAQVGAIVGLLGGPIGVTAGALLGAVLGGTTGGITAYILKKL